MTSLLAYTLIQSQKGFDLSLLYIFTVVSGAIVLMSNIIVLLVIFVISPVFPKTTSCTSLEFGRFRIISLHSFAISEILFL